MYPHPAVNNMSTSQLPTFDQAWRLTADIRRCRLAQTTTASCSVSLLPDELLANSKCSLLAASTAKKWYLYLKLWRWLGQALLLSNQSRGLKSVNSLRLLNNWLSMRRSLPEAILKDAKWYQFLQLTEVEGSATTVCNLEACLIIIDNNPDEFILVPVFLFFLIRCCWKALTYFGTWISGVGQSLGHWLICMP